MVISYPAPIPDNSSVWCTIGRTVPRVSVGEGLISFTKQDPLGDSGAYLIGRFTDRNRDVSADYYRSRGKRPPYLELARCSADEESAIRFTKIWGPLA